MNMAFICKNYVWSCAAQIAVLNPGAQNLLQVISGKASLSQNISNILTYGRYGSFAAIQFLAFCSLKTGQLEIEKKKKKTPREIKDNCAVTSVILCVESTDALYAPDKSVLFIFKRVLINFVLMGLYSCPSLCSPQTWN